MEFERRHFDIIDSTNTWAKLNAHLLPRDKITLVTAEGQTAGRGRYSRKWDSPPGQNIYASFCIFADRKHTNIWNLPSVLSLSITSVFEKLGFDLELNWPNDLLISKKKVGGILSETTQVSDQICMIIGVGLNINMTEEYLKLINKPATSLMVEKGHVFDIEDILHSIKVKFAKNLALFFEEGFTPFFGTYCKYVSFKKPLKFDDARVVWEGELHCVNPDGSLTLKLKTGELKTLYSGEIVS